MHELHNDLPFLPERKKIEKVEKLVVNLHGKTECVIHIRNLKQAWISFIKVHKKINFNQNAWLKSYIDMNIDLRKKAKRDFEKDFFKLMNNAVFGKTVENVRKHREIKLVTTERRRKYLVLERNYHTSKIITKYVSAIEMEKTEILINKPDYFGLSILELSKILMYEFWYDYVKPQYEEK